MPQVATQKSSGSHLLALRLTACLVFLVVSLFWVVVGRDERSGWILMTSPTGADHDGNSLLCYSFLHGDEPFMKEDIPHVGQVGAFCGCLDAFRLSEYRQDFRLFRGLYSLLASLVAPFIGVIPSMLLVNWLSWALCAWVTWRLTRAISGDELAGLLSVVLVSGGMGMTTHIGDYSPHLLSFATYYLGVWLIYDSRVYAEQRPWRTHFWLGLYFAIACLAYNTGVMLVGIYLLSAVRRNFSRLPLAAVIGLSARPLWQALLLLRMSIEDTEAHYFNQALHAWSDLFQQDFYYIAKTVTHWASEYVLFFDSPLIVVVGLACCLVMRRTLALRWFAWLSLAIPIMAALVFTPIATARGYLVYGGSIWLYVGLATASSKMLRSPDRQWRWTSVAVLVLILMSHFAWSTAHLVHFIGPVKSYFLGWDNGLEYLLSPRTEVRSLTDQEPTPVLFGGQSSLSAAGAYVGKSQHQFDGSQVSFIHALMARGWFFMYFALFAAAAARGMRERVLWVGVIALLCFVSCATAAFLFRSTPAFFKVDEAVPLKAGQTLRYELTLGAEMLDAVRRQLSKDDELAVFLRGPHEKDKFNVSIYVGDKELSFAYRDIGKYVIRNAALPLNSLSHSDKLVVQVTNAMDHDTFLLSWQRGNLSRRKCTYLDGNGGSGDTSPNLLPALELRLLRSNGRCTLAGF